MKKYVLTDDHGDTPDHVHLEPGKVVHSASTKSNDPMVRVITSGYDSPVLAMLESDDIDSKPHKLFVLNTWSVNAGGADPKAYTVIKEVPLPSVNLQHKVAFAVGVIAEVFDNADFTKWAQGWVSGSDRSEAAALELKKKMLEEREAAEGLAELAAWGVSNEGDSAMIDQQEDAEERAMHVATAAAIASRADASPEEVQGALALALKGIAKYQKKVNLTQIAQKVIGIELPD